VTRPISFRCSWGIHNADEVDDCGRKFCSRCGTRQPVRYRVLNDIEQQGREMIRPKTKGAKKWM
jgi:hypothetical protein